MTNKPSWFQSAPRDHSRGDTLLPRVTCLNWMFQSAPRDHSRGDSIKPFQTSGIRPKFQSAPRDHSRGDFAKRMEAKLEKNRFNPRPVITHGATLGQERG